MEKLILLSIAAGLLYGCTATTTQTTHHTSSKHAPTTQTTTTSVQTTVSDDKKIEPTYIAAGNYSSVEGTWRNKAGHELIFGPNGLLNPDLKITSFHIQHDILYAQVVSTTAGNGWALNFIPKGTKIPDQLFHTGTDPSDITRDRLFGAQSLLDSNTLDPYYRVEE